MLFHIQISTFSRSFISKNDVLNELNLQMMLLCLSILAKPSSDNDDKLVTDDGVDRMAHHMQCYNLYILDNRNSTGQAGPAASYGE